MLAAGTQLGPYEILSPLGAGGMGEVYRARDTRLGREVAIKLLPAKYSKDAERLRRFEQEARAAGMLNHPNILTVYDVGTHQGSPYLVSELLEGETLRDRIRAAQLSTRKTVDYALQIARGLAAAHAKGITHRDLKPQNLFLTRDGRVKILDFGLAKLTAPELETDQADASTLPAGTEPGAVLGTVGYMSPEQVRGRPADHRSDIFSFGAILFEMLTRRQAFHGESAVETMNAILKEDLPEFPAMPQDLSPALERLLRHCLEKNPDDRFQSARDLAFDLEALSADSGARPGSAAAPVRFRRWWRPALAALMAMAALAAGLILGQRWWPAPAPSFQRLTFQRGAILSARFAPDGQTIVYGSRWDDQPIELFSTRAESPDSRALGLPSAEILAVSSSGEMAVSLRRRFVSQFVYSGTLARASLGGGAPRELLEDVQQADWAPGGGSLAVVRSPGGRTRLEFPIGKTLYETAGWISHPRISPNGQSVAFLDHPVRADDGGDVAVVDWNGNKRTLSSKWLSAQGLAWFRQGREEVWFTATRVGGARALYAVSLSGKERLVARVAGALTLHDISRDGRVLVTRDDSRAGIIGLAPGQTRERDLSWLDFGFVRDISADGGAMLFDESGEGGGATYAVFLRRTDGSPAVRLGDGTANRLSPDGKWALAITHHGPARHLVLLPTGPGEPQTIESAGLNPQGAVWLPDGNRIVIMGNEAGRRVRLYLQDLAGGKPVAITPEGVAMPRVPVSPDGQFVIGRDLDRKLWLYPIAGGLPRPMPGAEAADVPIQWGDGGRSLYVFRPAELAAQVFHLDLASGSRKLWKQFAPADPAGVVSIGPIHLTTDGKAYVYSYFRILSDLYLVRGLR